MILDSSQKFVIEVENIKFILHQVLKIKSTQIMNDVIMTRTIFEPLTSTNERKWLRVRVGDVDCEGKQMCTITLRKKDADMSSIPMSAKLVVEDYYEAINMFKSLGMRRTSIQETKRSKYVCYYETIKYVVCFDKWPGLDDIIFVSITPSASAEHDDISGFLDLLTIGKYALKSNEDVDIDNEYLDRYNITASEVPRLSFDFPLD